MSVLDPPSFSGTQSALVRPVAALALVVGWMLRAFGVLLGLAAWAIGVYGHTTGMFGGH